MPKLAIPTIFFLAVTSLAVSSFATLDQNRHTGSYSLDYSHVTKDNVEHEDYLIGSIHGAIAYTSNWGNGATGFHWEFPLVPISDDMRAQIEDARDDFIDGFEAFVDKCDWQFNWFGDITYNNLIIQGNWKTIEEREAEKDVIKRDGAAYAYASVENAIENWNLMFENLPQNVHVNASYGSGIFEPIGVGTFYFDGNDEHVWPSAMVNNARLTLPYIVPHSGFLDGTHLPEGQILGLGCLTWTAADEIGCFALDKEEPCKCESSADETICYEADGGVSACEESEEVEEEVCTYEEDNCANECRYLDETVDMLSFAGMIGELTCVGTIPGIILGFDVGYGIAGAPRGTLEPAGQM